MKRLTARTLLRLTAAAEFIAAKTAKKLRPDSLRTFRGRNKGLLAAHGLALVNEITPANIAALINKPTWSACQSSNERRVLTKFFRWCVKQKYCPDNPVPGVDAPVIEHGEVAVLSLADTRKLLAAALTFEGGALVPQAVLSIFCGLRPSEVARLSWSDVDLEAGTVKIRPSGTKTRSPRIVQMEAKTAAWLTPHFAKTPIQAPRKKWDKLRREAGFDLSVSNDVARREVSWPDILPETAGQPA